MFIGTCTCHFACTAFSVWFVTVHNFVSKKICLFRVGLHPTCTTSLSLQVQIIHPHDLARDLHSTETYFLLDCRPVLAYHTCHIAGVCVCVCVCVCVHLAVLAYHTCYIAGVCVSPLGHACACVCVRACVWSCLSLKEKTTTWAQT